MVRDFPAYHGQHSAPLNTTLEVSSITHPALQSSFICKKIHHDHSVGIFYGENPLRYSSSLFFLEIVLVILFTQITRFLLKPLRQPRIVSELIGGIIIGPSVLGQSQSFTNNVFPQNAHFVIKTVGELGYIYFLFVTGIKMDLTLIRKTGRKHWYTAFIGMALPSIVVIIVGFIIRSSMEQNLARISGIGAVATGLALTSFPVLYVILKELNLFSSEVGRMALSTALVGDGMGIVAVIIFEALKQADVSNRSALWYIVSLIVFVAFLTMVVRPLMLWIIQTTPEGKPVAQSYIIIILISALVMGFLADMFGIAVANGPFWLGLIIPDGPPLGSTLVDRSETITMEILMPVSFAALGLRTNVFTMVDDGWSRLSPLFKLVMTGYAVKLVAFVGSAIYFKHTFKDALTLSFIMNLRGQIEILLFLHWMDKQIIEVGMYSMLVLLTLVMTGLFSQLVTFLYDPTRPYMVNKRRTVQHTPSESELRLLVCIHDQESITGVINFLEISYPTESNPIAVYVLHLIELIARATPALIDHEKPEGPYVDVDHEAISTALQQFQVTREEFVKLHSFTAITVKQSMHQDICELAMTQKVNLIILPFNMERFDSPSGTEVVRHTRSKKSIYLDVLKHAPCSVALLVDKGLVGPNNRVGVRQSLQQQRVQKYVMLFLGGADAREALTFADRMAANPEISLLVIRFLSLNNEGDDGIEKKLDDGVVTWFWVKNETNDSVMYREVVVQNGQETVAAIQALNDGSVHMWIMGRKQGINPVLLQGMSTWGEKGELGLIGDLVTSADFGSTASVLVFQQQIMRGQGTEATDSGLSSPPKFAGCTNMLNKCTDIFKRNDEG